MLQSQYTQVMLVTKMNNLDLNQTFKSVSNRWKYAIAVIFLLVISPAFAGEWNNKPVICADDIETFTAMSEKEEILVAVAKQLTKVRDPDEADGIANNPAILPWAIYANIKTGTFTVLEYHSWPYEQYCTIGWGVEFELVPENIERFIEWQTEKDGMGEE